jgi:arylsulfatase A-like enzyme
LKFPVLALAALALLAPAGPAGAAPAPRPHIVFFLADDLGWKDVGYHGGEIKTPHIDKLANAGVRLEQFYVLPVCSPTRAALMTGRYPLRYGLQVGVVRPWATYGLPLEERTLAQALRGAGYRTAITGKWHLGHFDRAYLPTARGFDHQYGHYNGALDYYTHLRDGGLDWHRDDKALREEGYTTQLIAKEAARLIAAHDPARPLFLYVPFNAPHAPLQAPADYLKRYKHLTPKKRRTHAAMVACLDDAVGAILAALNRRGMAKDTLILFSSDNGGRPGLGADNGPLRAGKATLYEGGTRVPAWAHWPGRLKPGVVHAPLHMVDWYPTLLKLGGAPLAQKLPLDGLDMWPTLAEGKAPARKEVVYNVEPQRGAVRVGDWKLVVHGKLPRPAGGGTEGVELFDLADDPFEMKDLAAKRPEKVRELLARLNALAKEAAAPRAAVQKMPAGFKAPKVYGEKDG